MEVVVAPNGNVKMVLISWIGRGNRLTPIRLKMVGCTYTKLTLRRKGHIIASSLLIVCGNHFQWLGHLPIGLV